ncbi:MAG: toll/interleukin-1 receptor domain-containing protein [Chloroflexi bacterium]|uniref:toll/interleukin-1 receptor domain-containing protein n=1 Tax=Candidatus Flexifilum breve TaxID=3140694 RepID=UPI00313536B5|nr:toll/interleukin-1 receptor domain-containing protein [Chloroflexota bacterium]
MAHVFISYHRDSSREYARRLADYLIEKGFDVWIDDQIDYGTEWERVIFEEGLDNATALIVIMTRGAWESEWVRSEREYAAYKKIPILPLRIEEFIFPPYLTRQYVDLRETEGRPHRLPPEDFLKRLAQYVIRKSIPGEDATQRPSESADSALSDSQNLIPITNPLTRSPNLDPAQVVSKLNEAALQLTADAILISRNEQVYNYIWQISEEDLREIIRHLPTDLENMSGNAKIRFVSVENSAKDYMLYSRLVEDNIVVSMVFSSAIPLREIRRQGQKLLEVLGA